MQPLAVVQGLPRRARLLRSQAGRPTAPRATAGAWAAALAAVAMLLPAPAVLATPQAQAPSHTKAKAPAAAGRAAGSAALEPEVQSMRQWVFLAQDNEGLPFAVIDKRRARLWLFDASGTLLAHSPVLLGAAVGDASVPGIGERPIAQIQPHERTTPAGRFVAEPGHNANGEDIFWVDYDAAVSMHRVRATNPAERRLQRLDTPTAADNRISYGCINVPAAFYDTHLRPLFSARRGVVYLLPETLPASTLFSPVLPGPHAQASVRPTLRTAASP